MPSSSSSIGPIQDLVRQREFGEALALLRYLPDTAEHRLARCLALAALGRHHEADRLLPRDFYAVRRLAPGLASIATSAGIDLAIVHGSSSRWTYLSLEALLVQKPDQRQRIIDLMVPVLKIWSPFERALLDRLLDLDSSPARLVQYARAVMPAHDRSRAERNGAAQELVLKAIGEISVNDEGFFPVTLGAVHVVSKLPSPDLSFINSLLQQALNHSPVRRLDIASAYFDLGVMSGPDKQEFWGRGAALTANPGEFFKLRHAESLGDKLFALASEESILPSAPWYREGVADSLALRCINEIPAEQRIEGLLQLIRMNEALPARSIPWIRSFLEAVPVPDDQTRKYLYYLSSPVQAGLAELMRGTWEGKPPDPGDLAWEAFRELQEDIEAMTAYPSPHPASIVRVSAVHTVSAPSKPTVVLTRQIVRHTRIDFPDACTVEQKVELKVQLTQSTPRATRALKALRLNVSRKASKVALDIQVTAPDFAIQNWRRRIHVPVDQDSKEITFVLVPLKSGKRVVEIEFFHRACRVGYILLRTRVTDWREPEKPSDALSMEDPVDGLQERIMGDKPGQRTIALNWCSEQSKLFYNLQSSVEVEGGEWMIEESGLKDRVVALLRNLNDFLYEVVSQGSPGDQEWDSICLNLRGVGHSLFMTLIPAGLASQAKNWAPGSRLLISTNEQWIPWELMYDGEAFWGEKFLLARYPRLGLDHAWPETSRPKVGPCRPLHRIVNVIGGGVPAAEAERAARLFEALPAHVTTAVLREQPVATLGNALPGADALHCTCHGHLEPHLLQVAGDKTRILNLGPDTVQMLPLEAGCFVFANACASSVPMLTFGKFTSFGWEFYRRGARTFIGTLGAVPTGYAVSFAEAVYRELLRPENTLGEALATAKRDAAAERNLFWLFYCVYGDPDYRFEITS